MRNSCVWETNIYICSWMEVEQFKPFFRNSRYVSWTLASPSNGLYAQARTNFQSIHWGLLGAHLYRAHANEAERGTHKGFVFKNYKNKIKWVGWIGVSFQHPLFLFIFLHTSPLDFWKCIVSWGNVGWRGFWINCNSGSQGVAISLSCILACP